MNNKMKKPVLFVIMAALLIGAYVCIYTGIKANLYLNDFNDKAVEIVALVEKIEADNIYVTYEVDGKKYEKVNVGYDTTAIEGKGIYVYYNRYNPGEVLHNEHEGEGGAFMYILGGIFVVLAIVCLCGALGKFEKKADKKVIKDKIFILLISAVFLGGGIFMITYSSDFNRAEKKFNSNAVAVTAYVDKVVKGDYSPTTGRVGNTVAYVSYEVEGVKYNMIEVNHGAVNLTEGNYETVYYNKNNPSQVRAEVDDDRATNVMLKVVGGICTLIGGFIFFGTLFTKSK